MGELESIRVFLAVADEQSFVGAARVLGMSAASVTRTVAALEEHLGLQLLVRTTRQVSLTSAGAVYAARVTPLAQGLSRVLEETRESQGFNSGLIRVSIPVSLGFKIMPDIMASFILKNPNTSLAINLSDSFVDIVSEGYDLAVRISGPPNDKSTIWRKICEVPRVLVASADYLARQGVPQHPADLANHPNIAYSNDSCTETWNLSRGAEQFLHRTKGMLSVNSGELLARLVVMGQGIALLPKFMVKDELSSGEVVELLPEWSAPQIWLMLYYPPYERLPLRVAAFSDFFETYIADKDLV